MNRSKTSRRGFILYAGVAITAVALGGLGGRNCNSCSRPMISPLHTMSSSPIMKYEEVSRMPSRIEKSEVEWKNVLTLEEFHILREKGTDPPYSGKYVETKEKGIYLCAGCGNPLFSSDTKYDSGTGWPSFWNPLSITNIEMKQDNSVGMQRTEVLCKRCGGHLGHVFNDGPDPSGLRFCISSTALHFKELEET